MRILIVGLNFAPELTGVGKYSGEMAAWLAQRGHDVTVITTRPYYPQWTRATGWRRWLWQREAWQGCRVIRCPLYVPSRVTALRRVLHLVSFALSSLPAVLARLFGGRAEVVIAVVPTLLSAPLALATARLLAAKAWIHIQDLEIDAAGGVGVIRNRGVVGMALRLERVLLKRFDLVSAISPKMLEVIARKGVARDRLMLFPNWVETSRIFPLASSRGMRRELGLPEDACIVLYSGSMGRKQGLEYVVEAARSLASTASPPLFVLAGAGPARAELQERAKGLPNIRFLPLQPEERFNEFLNIGDVHVLPQRRDATDLVMPSKLGAMLASGKPVVATVPTDSQVAAVLAGAGIVVPPENAAALAGAIDTLAKDPARRRVLGAEALRRARDTLESRVILAQMEARLAALLDAAAASTGAKRPAKEERRA